MKRLLALLLTICILAMCCGCDLFGGNSSKPASSSKPDSSTQSEEETPEDEIIDDSSDNSSTKTTPAGASKKTKTGTVETDGDFGKSPIDLKEDESESLKTKEQTVEWGTSVSTLDTPWDKETLPHPKTSSDAEATAMRNKVLNSGNTEEYYTITGTKYYISPKGNDANDGKSPATAFRTTDVLAASKFGSNLKPGDAVLFERGGVWRLSEGIKCAEGIIYGSYGTGEKPAFYGSAENYADKKYWTASNLKNVWKTEIKAIDIAIMVFDHGDIVGVKTKNGLLALAKNGDYYYNRLTSTLYIFCDKGNPGKVYKDIEAGAHISAFNASYKSGIKLDNLKIKYFAHMAVNFHSVDDSAVTNCETGFIGGAYQNDTTRLGNAIQMWQGCDGHIVENCWVYQVYDTGISPQGNAIKPEVRKKQGTHEEDYKNITYRGNLIEYCAMSIEIWHGNHDDGLGGSWEYTDGVFENIHIDHNISRMAGYGWSSMPGQRPDPHGEHLIFYKHVFPFASEFYIEDNIFDIAYCWICRWDFNDRYAEDTNDATRKKIDDVICPIVNKLGVFTIRNNTYYHGESRNNGINWYGTQKTGSGQATLESLVGAFDASPTKVVWVTS